MSGANFVSLDPVHVIKQQNHVNKKITTKIFTTHQKAHDLVGTNEEEAKNLPGSLLGLLLTLPKKVLLFLSTIVIAIIITTIGIFSMLQLHILDLNHHQEDQLIN